MNPTEAHEFLESAAFQVGRRAGKNGLSPSLNPHSVGSFEYLQWQRGHLSVTTEPDAELNNRAALARAVS